jgi:hypothetical protein
LTVSWGKFLGLDVLVINSIAFRREVQRHGGKIDQEIFDSTKQLNIFQVRSEKIFDNSELHKVWTKAVHRVANRNIIPLIGASIIYLSMEHFGLHYA